MKISRSLYICLALVVLVIGVFVFGNYTISSGEGRSAKAFVATCSKEGDRAACYEREVPALYSTVPVANIFSVIREIRKSDSSYQFCHVLAHKIGERVVAEDPERWINAIPLNPSDGLCSNGFIHGVVGGRFRAEVLDDATLQKLLPDFKRACEPHDDWKPSQLDKAICYHGLGHLYDFITDANLNKALSLCEETTTEQFRRVCHEGVFMQIYQPLEPDDYLMIERMSVKPTKTTVRTFCASFKDSEYVGACLRESWPYFRQDILDHGGAKSFCSGQPGLIEESRCYESISAIVGRMSLGNSQKAAKACDSFPSERQEVCYSTSAQAVLEENRAEAARAIELCELAPAEITRNCISLLVDRAPFIFGSGTRAHNLFCNAVPDREKERCLRQK